MGTYINITIQNKGYIFANIEQIIKSFIHKVVCKPKAPTFHVVKLRNSP